MVERLFQFFDAFFQRRQLQHAENLHGAEHSSRLSHVMAGGSSATTTMTDLLPEPELQAVAICATCVSTLRARSAIGSRSSGGAYSLQE